MRAFPPSLMRAFLSRSPKCCRLQYDPPPLCRFFQICHSDATAASLMQLEADLQKDSTDNFIYVCFKVQNCRSIRSAMRLHQICSYRANAASLMQLLVGVEGWLICIKCVAICCAHFYSQLRSLQPRLAFDVGGMSQLSQNLLYFLDDLE